MINNRYPNILDVENCIASEEILQNPLWTEVIDYRIYQRWPKWWRKVEQFIHFDLGLAWEARKKSHGFDVVWTWSEKTSIPLAFMSLSKPLITVCHNLSPLKILLIKLFHINKKWYAVGYVSDYDKKIMQDQFQVSEDHLFRCISAPIDCFTPCDRKSSGSIISLGVAKRDYPTLIAALEQLSGYETQIFISSCYGDRYHGFFPANLPSWVNIKGWVSKNELIDTYQNARFVVLPLMKSTQAGAGASVAIEAASCGKAVIATRSFGMSTFVVDNETGILVPPGDVDALRKAIQFLYENPELARKMGLAGRQLMEMKFHPCNIRKQINQVLSGLYRTEQ